MQKGEEDGGRLSMGSAELAAAARRLAAEDEDAEEAYVLALKISAIFVLSALSAVFSGLNLGLMCLDCNQLVCLANAASRKDADKEAKQQAVWAKRILPLRKDGNTLLCTILLGNVMVNSYMTILLGEMWDGTIAVVASTLIIVTFGEILPQSICYKHGLRIGSTLVPLVTFFWYLLLPVVKPLALILDKLFGEEMGQVLDRQQLVALINYQRKRAPHLMTEEEAKIFRGSLDFSARTVQNIMVPLSECFCLDAHAVINPGLCAAVAAAGYSRIPVIDRNRANHKKQFAVVGLIHVKDLLLLEVEHEVPLKALLPLIGREVFVVDDDRPLPELLDEFRKGRSQLAVVRGLVDDEDCDPYFRHVGILTLQDLLNTIVQDDVHEVDADDKDSEVSSVPSGMFSNVRRFCELNDLESVTSTLSHQGPVSRAHHVQAVRALSRDEVIAAAAFLRQRYPMLFGKVEQTRLEVFLDRECRLVGGPPDGDGPFSRALYQRGQACDFATLVITGEVKVSAGQEAYESIHGPWSLLGKRCLELERDSGGGRTKYRPDFTAYTAEREDGADGATRLLLINVEAYHRLLSGQAAMSLLSL
eukprot:TRINITY_DN44594_c0_g1_i1.p1 TRINITY_DN44594_c0_g1~~TRINITY_DN44594_c0_g1_i1.p1  ORF type:complete len:589 (-),score=140.40 TRINITY_DN44594_c0_g1_i1:71-1837(-)